MSVTFVGATQATPLNATGMTVSKPAGTSQGDVILVLFAVFDASGDHAGPSGWTRHGIYNGSAAGRVSVWWKVAGPSEPPSYTFTPSSGQEYMAAVAATYRGVSQTAPIEAIGATEYSSNASAFICPSVTVSAGAWALRALFSYYLSHPDGSTAVPAGMTRRARSYLDGYVGTEVYDEGAGEAPGSSGSASFGMYRGDGAATGTRGAALTVALAVGNVAPNAPTLTTLVGGEVIDRAAVNRASHTFSDPDAGDSQSAFDHRYRLVGSSTWTSAYVASPNSYTDYPAGTFAAGDYERQVRTYDAQGVVGPWSASGFFTAADTPATPTITDPINGATVSQSETTEWSAPDQDAYQHRRVADNAGSPDTATIYEDSGEVVTTTARSRPVTFATNNRFEHVQLRVKDNGLWSAWASVRVQVSYTPPPTPVVSLLADDDAGALIVTVTNPAPGSGEPPVIYNDIYVDDGGGEFRAATQVPPNSSWTYWTPKSGREYAGSARAVAIADNGTTASS